MTLPPIHQLAARTLVAVALSACVVTTAESPPPRSAPPPAETRVMVAPPPPAVAAQEPQPAPPPPAVVMAPPPPAVPAVLAPPRDGRYPIQLDRRAVPGAVYRFRAHGTKSIQKRTSLPGQPPQSDTQRLSIDLSGLVRIANVDANGDATLLEVTVEQCRTESSAAGPEALLPTGAQLVVESAIRPARGRFLVGGREVDAHLSDYLEIVFGRSHNATSDDDAFGTPVPRRAGERWNVNAALIAADLSEQIPGLTPADVRGRAQFYRPSERDGRPVLDVGVQLDIRARAMPNLPPGTVLERGDMRIEMRGMFPRDTSLPSVEDSMEMTLRARLHVPTPAGTATLDMVIEQAKELERSPVR